MPSIHACASLLIRRGLYDNLHSFAELEQRISALGDESTKIVGDAFEVFVEGYLATNQKMQAETVWLVGQVPQNIRQQLNLPSDAKGIDGVFRSRTGTLVPYQVKFRSQRAYLTYTQIAPFLGLTERATDRIVFTNSNELAEDVKNRDAMRTVRGIDFDDLTKDDLRAISAWLREQPVAIPKPSPYPYQKTALEKIAQTFENSNRAHVVMACGTGKTLVALWAVEQIRPRTVLVLVPSLTLLQQTLDEWTRHTSWGDAFSYICVCSDPTVSLKDQNDPITFHRADAEFRVDTDPEVVRAFLERDMPSSIKVIFSTYQSSPIVSEGFRGLPPLDVAVFDEAHKTATRQGELFAHSLQDENIRIRNRLFLTATPRHYDIRRRDKEGDFRIVSMDDESIYGPRAYTLTFGSAARQGIICNYKIVISVVDGQEVNELALKHGITLVEGDLIGAKWVANQIAVERAIEKTGAKRGITFHSRVSSAKMFSSDGTRGIRQFLPEFSVFHVNGEQKSSERKQIVRSFRDAAKGLVTNARCLTEGIDVPAVDMVAFIDPRHSRIDIAQATGRAMRKPPGLNKEVGYVVIPLFLDRRSGETLEQAIERSEFDDVADVLNAMQEQDEDLVQIIREAKQAKGLGEVFDPRTLNEKVEVLRPSIELSVLTSNILAEIVDSIGDGWDEWYGRLKAYKARFGDCRVPAGYLDHGRNLGSWVQNQRYGRRTKRLSEEKRKRLDDLGFEWDPLLQDWEEGFMHLKSFKDRVGNCHVPVDHIENGFKLNRWVRSQRDPRYVVSEERRRRLDEIGFVWDTYASKWEIGLEYLKLYKDRLGDCRVPIRHLENGYKLGEWVSIQRMGKSKLSAEQRSQLDGIGFEWDVHSAKWDNAFTCLKTYRARVGDCCVPKDHIENGLNLGRWVEKQRRGWLPEERRKKLNDLGFVWDPLFTDWEEGLKNLKSYKDRTGDWHVPVNHVENGFALGRWVSAQLKRKHILSESEIDRLASLGFDWGRNLAHWEQGFRHLKAYKDRVGHCEVRFHHVEDNFKLGRWVTDQRNRKRTLSPEQKERLNAIGFAWDVSSKNWEKAFACLEGYKNRTGDCSPPKKHIENSVKLGRWVHNQRRSKDKLSDDQRQRLDEIGFEWNPRSKGAKANLGLKQPARAVAEQLVTPSADGD
jgi:superfamily II DNA or RNA helicase